MRRLFTGTLMATSMARHVPSHTVPNAPTWSENCERTRLTLTQHLMELDLVVLDFGRTESLRSTSRWFLLSSVILPCVSPEVHNVGKSVKANEGHNDIDGSATREHAVHEPRRRKQKKRAIAAMPAIVPQSTHRD